MNTWKHPVNARKAPALKHQMGKLARGIDQSHLLVRTKGEEAPGILTDVMILNPGHTQNLKLTRLLGRCPEVSALTILTDCCNSALPFGARNVACLDVPDQQETLCKMVATSLISELLSSGILEKDESLVNKFQAEILRLQSDSDFYVRREVAFAIGELAKIVQDDVVFDFLVS